MFPINLSHADVGTIVSALFTLKRVFERSKDYSPFDQNYQSILNTIEHLKQGPLEKVIEDFERLGFPLNP